MNQDNSDFPVTKMARRALLKMPVQFPGIYSVLYYSPIKQYKYKKWCDVLYLGDKNGFQI